MKIDEELLNQLKKAHAAGLYEGAISFTDEEEKLHTEEFIYRKPTTIDIEAHQKASQRNPLIANLNLVQSLIVHPDSGTVVRNIKDYPAAYGRFVDEAVSPFFGANVMVKSRKL